MTFLALFSAKSIKDLSFWLTWMATLCIAFGAELVGLGCSAFLAGAWASAPEAARATTIEAKKNSRQLRDRVLVIVASRQATRQTRRVVMVRALVERKFQFASRYPAPPIGR